MSSTASPSTEQHEPPAPVKKDAGEVKSEKVSTAVTRSIFRRDDVSVTVGDGVEVLSAKPESDPEWIQFKCRPHLDISSCLLSSCL